MTGSIVWLDADAAEADVGAKMGRLARLGRLGVLVPRGFTVTTAAYREHCARIEEAFAERGPDAAARIRDAIVGTPLSGDLAAEIT
jgi:phosphoenolpyruvate synthase/pyruvate phosphate dikinase